MATGSTTLYSNGGTSKDYVNNVESIDISQPMACGDDWAVTVTASHLYYPTENPSQPYALVISGAGYVGGMVYTSMPSGKPTVKPSPKPTTPTIPKSDSNDDGDGDEEDGPDEGALGIIGDAVIDYWSITKNLFTDIWNHITKN